MEPASNSNHKNNNATALEETTPIIIDNPNRKNRSPSIKSLCKDPIFEGLRKGIIEAAIMSGFLCNCIPVTSEDPANNWVKLYNNVNHQEHKIFRHCEVSFGVKKHTI